MKNKRGDIPVTILVLGVVGICALAMLSFFLSERSGKGSFESVGVVEKAAVEAEKIIVYRNLGFNDAEITEIFNIKQDTTLNQRYIEFERGNVKVRYIVP